MLTYKYGLSPGWNTKGQKAVLNPFSSAITYYKYYKLYVAKKIIEKIKKSKEKNYRLDYVCFVEQCWKKNQQHLH